jgi:hypothetical protein
MAPLARKVNEGPAAPAPGRVYYLVPGGRVSELAYQVGMKARTTSPMPLSIQMPTNVRTHAAAGRTRVLPESGYQ